ncbi:MAG: O-antigen ligase family protein [Deltaproteobacteria bacterium]|nr:O-antigen ligase family protein [Deltaproteobacteria bacterium]
MPEFAGQGSVVVVVAVVGLACVLLAGIQAAVHVALFAGAVLALVLLAVDRVRRRRPVRVSVLALPLVVGALLTTFSLLPLPHGLRAFLSAESTDRIDRLALLLAPENAARILPVLAFDPPEAALALLRLLFGVVVVVVCAHQSRERRERSLVNRSILVVAFVVGGAVLFASAVGIPRFFEIVGVPVNPNHRARVCGALALLCLGRALTLRPRVEASWFAVGGVLCALLVFVTMSKGGIAAFAVGVVTLVAVVVRGSEQSRLARLMTPVAGAAVVVAGLFFLGERGVSALAMETLEHPERLKTFLWEPASRLPAGELLVGVGNNGFGVAFPSVLAPGELDATLTYSHAENTVLQTLADHGVVGGGLLLLIVFGLGVVVVRTLKTPGELAALPAVVFLLVGDVFDFVLETPAGIGLMAIALGLLAGRLAAHRSAFVSVTRRPIVAVVVVVVALWGALAAPTAVRGWRYTLDDDLVDVPLAERAAFLERALAAHPSDATYATLLALEARRRRDPQAALRFSNRAMVLWPAFYTAHLEAARALFVMQRPRQAMLEYREVWRVTGSRGVVAEIVQRTPDAALRRLALPQPERAVDVDVLCDALVREKRSIEARACADDAAALPDASDVHRRRAIELALAAGDLVDASEGIARLKAPHDGDEAVLAARVQAAIEGTPAALTTSSTWIAGAKNARPLLEWRLREQRSAGLYDDAEATIGLLRPLSRTPAQATGYDLALVDVRQKRGDPVGALAALRNALSARPRELALLLAKVKLETASGDLVGASATVRQMRSIAAVDDKQVLAAEALLQAIER